MTETAKQNTVSEVERQLELQSMNIEELVARAKEVGVTLKTTDKSAIIEALIAAAVDSPSSKPLDAGMLLSLHSRDDAAKDLIRAARTAIVSNEQENVYFQTFLKNQNGDKYSQRLPGVRLSAERIPAVTELVCLVPDGSQNAIFEEFKATPEAFKQPLLVRVRRQGENGAQNYVMLYIERLAPKSIKNAEF